MAESQKTDGARVFFKRKALKLLRSYWCHRWDNLELRDQLSLTYEPKYHVEWEHMGGFYLRLRRLDFLWYRGLFTVGRHLSSGRYYRDPVHLPLTGLGPREMVFPLSLLDHLSQLTLLGNWVRYQRSAEGFLQPGEQPRPAPKRGPEGEQLVLRVGEVARSLPPPVVARWESRDSQQETVCLKGIALNTVLQGLAVLVPINEVSWKSIPGYSERYLKPVT